MVFAWTNFGDISSGTYYDDISNENYITGGTFHGRVHNNATYITGGTFYGSVDNQDGHIRGGTFFGVVDIYDIGFIHGGMFYGGIKGNVDIEGNTVTFMKDGSEYAVEVVKNGETAYAHIEPTKEGYRFTGWYIDDTKYDFTQAVTEKITLTARWEEVHVHDWKFTPTENSLTATCGKSGCPIGTVGVALTAHSVTLPDSPFNARLEGVEQFKAATGVDVSPIRYDYKGSDGKWIRGIDPTAANVKAGEYQAFVQISNLPSSGEIAAFAMDQDGTNSEQLYVKYTAVDPAITAQTGDNRPIEIMMVSVAVLSLLAVAAFVLDKKRRYSR